MSRARLAAVLATTITCISCSRWDLPVEIPFHATWDNRAIACEGTTPALTDLRFYVTNPRLIDAAGREHDVRFATEFEWENDAVALIDLETGSGTCAGGSAETYDRVIGVARAGDYRGLRFTVGVPFRLNHADLRTASPPLDRNDMHSQTVSGYKFLRAGVAAEPGGFDIQLSSEGCNGSVGYVTGCERPNRIEVFLPDFEPGDGVSVNLDRLRDFADGLPAGNQNVFVARKQP